jgi:hypothetical protein
MHWGKFNFGLTPALMQKMYGDKIVKWKACRKQLLSSQAQKVFTNKFMVQCELND